MLTVNNISYIINNKKILDNISFTILVNSTLVISGKNGSGKTSLLKIIASLLKPDNGNILYNNIYDPLYYRKKINYIGCEKLFKDSLTLKENLLFYAQMIQNKMLINSALRYFEIEKYQDYRYSNLSSGIKKKALLCKLLIWPEKNIWVLDEVENNLDLESKKKLCNLINIRSKDGGYIILATHDNNIFNKYLQRSSFLRLTETY